MFRQVSSLLLLFMTMAASAQNIKGAPYVAVRGSAEKVVVPDRFPVSITLSDVSLDTAKLQEEVESLTKLIIETAESQGVASEDLTVSNAELSPERKWDSDQKKSVFQGNSYTRDIEIVFSSQPTMLKFVSALPESKYLRFETQTPKYSKEAELRQLLTKGAIQDAHSTAELLAEGAGMKLGGVHTISNQSLGGVYSSGSSPFILTAEMIDSAPVARNVTNVALLAPGTVRMREGSITISEDVYIVYRLLD